MAEKRCNKKYGAAVIAIATLLGRKQRLLVGIDGESEEGIGRLAAELKDHFMGEVFHLGDLEMEELVDEIARFGKESSHVSLRHPLYIVEGRGSGRCRLRGCYDLLMNLSDDGMVTIQ